MMSRLWCFVILFATGAVATMAVYAEDAVDAAVNEYKTTVEAVQRDFDAKAQAAKEKMIASLRELMKTSLAKGETQIAQKALDKIKEYENPARRVGVALPKEPAKEAPKAPAKDVAPENASVADGIKSAAIDTYTLVEICRSSLETEYKLIANTDMKQLEVDETSLYAKKLKEIAEGETKGDIRSFVSPTYRVFRPQVKVLKTFKNAEDGQKSLANIQQENNDVLRRKKANCMLGRYTSLGQNDDIPFINLNIPNGTNILTEPMLAKLRGKVDLRLERYHSTAYIFIANDGDLIITCKEGLKIDGLDVGTNPKNAITACRQGEHRIELWSTRNNEGPIQGANIKIHEKATNREVIPYNSLADIVQFLRTPIHESFPAELAPWKYSPQEVFELPVKPRAK